MPVAEKEKERRRGKMLRVEVVPIRCGAHSQLHLHSGVCACRRSEGREDSEHAIAYRASDALESTRRRVLSKPCTRIASTSPQSQFRVSGRGMENHTRARPAFFALAACRSLRVRWHPLRVLPRRFRMIVSLFLTSQSGCRPLSQADDVVMRAGRVEYGYMAVCW
jgi:hypothetical protein